MIRLKYCTVERFPDFVLTTFDNGATSANWPYPDDPFYVAVARECEFDDLMAYTWEHELLHSMMPEMLFDRPGYTVWMAAHRKSANLAAAMAEERLIYLIQRFIADPSFPCPDPQWVQIRDRIISLRDGVALSQAT